jgi:hypothetical protein
VGGLSALTGCVEFAGLAPPSGPAILPHFNFDAQRRDAHH